MSLVVAFWGRDYQLWCSDGMTVARAAVGLKLVSSLTAKIVKHPCHNLLHGWSGDKFDGETIISKIVEHSIDGSTAEYLESVGEFCNMVNRLSEDYSLRRHETPSGTGMIVGGYVGDSGFLAVVSPSGDIFKQKRYAVIGYKTEEAASVMHEYADPDLSVSDAYEMMLGCFDRVRLSTRYVNDMIFPFVVTPNTFNDMSSLTLSHRTSRTDRTRAHQREIAKITTRQ